MPYNKYEVCNQDAAGFQPVNFNTRGIMKQLGRHKKYVIIAAVVQSVIVIIAGYLLFKSKLNHEPSDSIQKKPHIEQKTAES